MKRFLIVVLAVLASCGGGRALTGAGTVGHTTYANAKDAVTAAGCTDYADLGPEVRSENSIGPVYPLATSQATCVQDGVTLKFAIYASANERQQAQEIGTTLVKAFVAPGSSLVLASKANLWLAQYDPQVQSSIQTTPETAAAIHKVADVLGATVVEVKPD